MSQVTSHTLTGTGKSQVACWILFICMILCAGVRAEEVSKIRAIVNNEVVTSKDVDDYCRFIKYKNPEFEITHEAKEEILQRLIEDKLILSEAKEEIKEVPARWLKEKLDEIIASYPSYEAFEESLTKERLTLTVLKEKLKSQYLIQNIMEKYVRSKIGVSPQEVTEYYSTHTLDFVAPKECILWVAKSEDREVLNELVSLLKETDIADVDCKKFNLSKIEVEEGSLKKEIKGIVRKLKEGEHAIENVSGLYCFVYLERNIPFSMIPIEKAKEKIYMYLWEQRFKKEFTVWLDGLKEKALIKIYE